MIKNLKTGVNPKNKQGNYKLKNYECIKLI